MWKAFLKSSTTTRRGIGCEACIVFMCGWRRAYECLYKTSCVCVCVSYSLPIYAWKNQESNRSTCNERQGMNRACVHVRGGGWSEYKYNE